ncbi:MAG: HlyC/CorC family transporter [Lentisphaeria bacterium]|nr:HlyC/CorC family transporter [Lentisphaeria bacterium]
MIEEYFTVISTLLIIFLFVISSVKECLSNLTRGKIRKLNAKDSTLEVKAEGWLEKRSHSMLTLNFLKVNLTVFTFVLFANFINSNSSLQTKLLILLTCIYAYVLIGQLLNYLFIGERSWKVLKVSMPLITFLGWILFPLLFPIEFISKKTITGSSESDGSIEDEILSLVEQDAHDEEGNGFSDLEDDERRMIQGILDLDKTPVKEIMTPRVDITGVDVNSSLEEVKAEILESGHSRLPVYEESLDNIIGLVYAKDLLQTDQLDENDLRSLLHRPPYIPESKNIRDLLEELRAKKRHISVIIDEYGGTSGLVTIEDILEEIVGEIQDEFDTNEITFEHTFNEDGSIELEGRLNVDVFNELMNANLEEDAGFDTLAGFVIDSIGRIPSVDEVLKLDQFTFTILEADDRRIVKMLVQPQKD